jgi:hypothetical protein
LFAGAEVHGSTLGIMGMGRIGQAIARRGALGFGMQVTYHNRSRLAPEVEAACGARYVGKDELLQQADHLVLVVPYSKEAHHTIGASEIARMKPTATLTNNDASTAAGVGAIAASGTTLTIASGVQGFVASSSINLGTGTLRVTGVAPVTLGSAVTANDVAASDATGAITLGLVGVGTVGTVVTGSGNDDITLSTAARTSGDYSISTGSGADSLTISFVEGFSNINVGSERFKTFIIS